MSIMISLISIGYSLFLINALLKPFIRDTLLYFNWILESHYNGCYLTLYCLPLTMSIHYRTDDSTKTKKSKANKYNFIITRVITQYTFVLVPLINLQRVWHRIISYPLLQIQSFLEHVEKTTRVEQLVKYRQKVVI